MQEERTRWQWGAALVAGAVLRMLFFHLRPSVSGDALMYGDLAHNVIAHHVFGFTGGFSAKVVQPTLIRLPGYPLFLAVCFVLFGSGNYLAVIWVQMAIDLGACAILGVLAARLAGRRVGVAAVWLAALCPFTANYTVVVLAESLSVFCVVAALFSLERWETNSRAGDRAIGWVLAIGSALSGAVLLRPDQGILAAAVIAAMLWVGLRRRGLPVWMRLAPAVVASLLVVMPLTVWTARNWQTFHVIQPLAPRYANDPGEVVPFGFQQWFRTWAVDYKATVDIYWSYDDSRMSAADLPARAFDNEQQMERTRRVFALYNKVVSATPEVNAAFAQIAAERIADHPLEYYVVLPVAREMDMWLRPRFELTNMPLDWWAFGRHPVRSTEELAYALLNAAYLGLAVVGIIYWRRRKWSSHEAVAFAMLGFVMLRCMLLLTLDNSEPRYTLECFPVIILLGSFVVAKLRDSVQ